MPYALIAATAASLATLPHLLSDPVLTSLPPPRQQWSPTSYDVFAALTVSPQGRLVTCKIVSSSAPSTEDADLCIQLKAAAFDPAKDGGGAPAYGRYTAAFHWPEGPKRPAPGDVDLTVKQLPLGSALRPRTALAVTVDAQGRVQACDVAETSGVKALDAAACKSGAPATVPPVVDERGAPVAAIRSFVVAFGAYQPLTFKKDREYSAMGAAGPYMPDRAARMGVGGYAILQCSAAADGDLAGCAVDEEAPFGFGFGAAALKMAEVGWMRTAAGRGGPVLVRIDYPSLGRR